MMLVYPSGEYHRYHETSERAQNFDQGRHQERESLGDVEADGATREGGRVPLRTAGEMIEKQGAGEESEGSEEWQEQGGRTAVAAELMHLSMDEVRHLMEKGRKPSSGGGVLEGLVAEVERCWQGAGGKKGRAGEGGGGSSRRVSVRPWAVLEQVARLGEVTWMGAGA
ncbi:hypothetical protein KFL_003490010 [Klebsormidium nitens]|uniref:Uncharacterized protein n=1 Tax=Klebsormidium nitens TaxID=105231 RepID=A0A1Y1IF75_KLENI|nr:hypothetical protein KFL_003490010 [Klebsormidium nitens]|eukprot:GAQ87377.1 hypothetical protein KFL_003490010 [Klebsormidium nitens]